MPLETSEDRLRRHRDLILAASGDGIYGLDTKGFTIFANPAALEMTGHTMEEMVGVGAHALIHHKRADGSPYPRIECPIYAAFKDGKVHQVSDEVFWRKDGTSIPVEYVSTPMWDDGKLVGAVVSFRDISERQAAGAALSESERRARELQSDLHHVSRLSAMGEMASGMAHELNQPITAVSNYIETIRLMLTSGDDLDKSEMLPLLDKAERQSRRAADIIRGLRKFVGKDEGERAEEDMNEVVAEAIDLATFNKVSRHIQTSFERGVDLPHVTIDKIRIQQVIVNLVRNAIDAMESEKHGKLIVRTSLKDGTLEVSVIDNGPGVASEVDKDLFRPFVTTKASGMGVGLSISKSIIEEHCGSLTAERNVDRGMTFIFTIPIAGTAS